MKKKYITGIVVFLLVAMFLVGCGNSNNNSNSKAQETNNEKVVTDFPKKNIELIVPFAAGGGTDAVARALANAAEKQLGQPVVIVNKTGGSGAVGMTEGANSKPDGYTVTMITREIVSLPLMGLASISADDFDLIANINQDPAMILVKSDSKYNSAKDLLDDAKKNPGQIKFASTAKPNFYVLALEIDQDVKFNHIPYNGAAEAIPAVLGGHVDFTITNPGEALSQIKAGQLRPLAVMADSRLENLPDVPTLKEEGIDVVSGTWRGLAVPKGTPKEVKDILSDAFKKACEDEQFVDFMEKSTLGIYYLDAEEFRTFIDNDTELLSKIVDELKKEQ
ncbi:conserved exported protein of unknown function [Tepidanaerobacter acetatoxydans Re1]|uniref:Uncharacterized protein n=1 Tax=Tepidanaerobacter acetatoxydans (strain DSM 21804 / JCM 16047 / Re1) TaxID=1209989 RepID=F4LR71_TEPAE|nr:tripartite tricarboxylate transporter substrate binding protein [Tepidanaerobacter acetatoxydans]AEE92224.1 hypothetical protein TepRe1_2101 [Tepidanaerobacter acetatoxydans Re1]CDI40938.1 conserved exported protein of unknown function [Tepidanaerobacter acetatoxydans Re1]